MIRGSHIRNYDGGGREREREQNEIENKPKDPEPIFFPILYFPPTLRSMLSSKGRVLVVLRGGWEVGGRTFETRGEEEKVRDYS